MKNQNDLIFSIVSVVIGLVLAVVFFATAPAVAQPQAPTAVDTTPPKLPSGDVVPANSLPGASNVASGGFGAAGMGGRGMGPGMGAGKRGMGFPGMTGMGGGTGMTKGSMSPGMMNAGGGPVGVSGVGK